MQYTKAVVRSRSTWNRQWLTCCNSSQRRGIFVQIYVISESVTRHSGAVQLIPSEICDAFFPPFVKSESGTKSWLSKLSKGDNRQQRQVQQHVLTHGFFILSPPTISAPRTSPVCHTVELKKHKNMLWSTPSTWSEENRRFFGASRAAAFWRFEVWVLTRPSWKTLSSDLLSWCQSLTWTNPRIHWTKRWNWISITNKIKK